MPKAQTNVWVICPDTPLPLLLFSPVLALAQGDCEVELFLFRCCLLALYISGPPCWYWGSRGLGLDRLQATCAAVLYFYIADQHSFGVGVNSLLCKGLLGMLVPATVLEGLGEEEGSSTGVAYHKLSARVKKGIRRV